MPRIVSTRRFHCDIERSGGKLQHHGCRLRRKEPVDVDIPGGEKPFSIAM